MPIDANSISWDSTPKVGGPAPSNIQWDNPAPAAKPANDDGRFGGVLGWLQTADRMSERGSHRLVAGVDRFLQGASQNIGLPDGVSNYLATDAKMNEDAAAVPVPGAVEWNDVKAHPSVGNIASYIGQSALGSSPDMAAALVAPWLYAGSREGDVAHTRAVNNGHGDNINLTDMALAAPTAAADTALMRYGLGGILGGEGLGLVRGAVNAAGRDALMGAGQPVLDQAGTTLGTNKAFDWKQAMDDAAAGAAAMAPFGAIAHVGVRAARGAGSGEEAGPAPTQPVSVRDQLTPEQADALTLHGIDVDTLEDPNMAKRAADRLLARNPEQPEQPAVIATPHGNVAPNADEQGRKFETIDANGGAERAKFEQAVGGAENATGDHNAKNPRSSASGDFQFTDDTFVRTYQKRFGTGESRESILAKKNDPRLQKVLFNDLTNANEDVMRRSGVPLTAGNYYLAHFAGAGGAVKLNRNPDAPVEKILGQKAVDENPFLAGMTGKDVVQWASAKMGEGKAPVATAGHAVDYPVRPSEQPDATMFRAPDHSEFQGEGYHFDPIEAPQSRTKPFEADTFNMGQGDGGGRVSKTAEELNQPGAPGEGMATGGMGRPFKADPNTGQFEDIQRDRVKQAEAEVEKRFEARRAEAERMKAEFEANRNRAGQNDASQSYSTFGTKPHFDPDMGAFRTTPEGFVADEAGNPVVWPTQGAAAKWAARFKMGGDFELQAHGTSAKDGEQPVTLQRKPGSTYGQEAPRAPAGEVPQLEHVQWDETPAPAEPANSEGGDLSTGAKGLDDTFPGDFTPEQTKAAAARRAFESNRPEDPGREPPKSPSFFTDVANYLANEKRRTGQSVKISAEDAIDHGVPAEYIYNDPKARYPTLKANAAKVFASTKAPLTSRGKDHRIVSLDHLGDRFAPEDYGVPRGDGVQEHRLAPEHAGDLLRRSMEKDDTARNRADPRFDTHQEWLDRMNALAEFEDRFGDDWTKLTDEQLAQLDPATFDAFYDDVLQAAERPDVDPFDPRFWESDGERQAHPGEAGQSEVQGSGREDTGRPGGDGGQPNDGADSAAHGEAGQGVGQQHDAFGSRPDDTRKSLERKADEPLRGTKEQKAPGSDGGLFDDASHGQRQGDMFDSNGLKVSPDGLFKEVRRLPDGTIFLEYGPDRLPIKMAIDDGVAEIAVDQFGHGANKLGPAKIREAMADLQAMYPEIKTFGGYRRSGAGAGRVQEITPKRSIFADERGSLNLDKVAEHAKALFSDERGTLDVGKVADFFVDRDAMRDAKEGVKALGARLRGTSARTVLTHTLDMMDHNRLIPSYFFSIDSRMRGLASRFNSPTIRKLADMFHARAGMPDGTERTYHEAVAFNSKRWNKVLFDTLHPFAGDDAAMERIRNIISKTGRGSKEETAAADRIAKMLKEIHDYRLDAGEDIGEVSDGYFPRILDPEAVVAKPDEFKRLAEGLFQKSGVDAKDAKVRAEMWFHQVVNENAGLDGAILDVRRAKAPGTTSGLSRKLGKEADTVLAKFYQKDPLDVLSSYITGSAKRAEFNRRFGMVGREGSPERAAWERDHGNKDQLDVIRNKINDEILASGRDPNDAQDLINSLLEANLGILGKASRTMRLGTSLAHAYNQIAKMDHSLVTSLNELAMGFVRGGPTDGLKYLGNTVKEFVRELRGMEPSEARRYAEHLGLILNPMMDQVLQSRISAMEGTRGLNKLVSRFYKAIGLHQFTEAERIAAAKMAREHLNVLAGDLDSSNTRRVRRAERALAELGITDHAAFKDWLAKRGGKARFDEIDSDAGMAAKWSTAVARMTDQTVMDPTRAVKPLWANHPVGSLLYGLMSYTMAFKKNVLDRAGNMALRGVKERDPHLLLPLLFGLPVLGAFTYLNDTYVRPAIFGSTYDFANETLPMGVLRAVDRSSMDGMLSPLVNVMFGTKYNRSLSEAFTGSFFGSVSQGVEKIAVNPIKAKIEGQQGNGADRQAAGAIYDLFVEPAIDGVLAGAVGGKVATAGIYASGTRPNSMIFPSDREAFIDAWAGPQSDGSGKGPFDGKSEFDSEFDKASGADAFDKQFK